MLATDRFWSPVRNATAVVGVLLAAAAGLAQVPAPSGPARAIVSEVVVQGNRALTGDQVRGMMKTRAGREFVPEVLQEDVRTLFATRQFGNVWADKQEDGPGKVKVLVYVRDLPTSVDKVSYVGNRHLSADELDAVANIRKGTPLNPTANKVACQRIVAKYNEDGRPFASCTLLKGADPGDSEVVFSITEGPKVRVRDISFTGNKFVSGGVLKTHINSSSKFLGLPIGGTYNGGMVEYDVNELIKYYRAFGFHQVRVARELQYSADGKEVSIVFHIHEGTRFKVKDNPAVIGVKTVPHDVLEAACKMKGGEFYDQAKIDDDTKRIKDHLGYHGHDASVSAIPVFSRDNPDVVTVNYEVTELPPARVGQIFIIGNDRTRQNVILRQLPLYPGQILTYPDLAVAERNLTRLGIFKNSPDGAVRPKVTLMDNPYDPSSPYKDVLVSVEEDNTGSLLFGIGVNSDTGLTGSIVLNERNFDLFRPPTSIDDFLNGTAFRGAGQEFRIEAVPGTQLQRYVVSFREPFLFDSPFSLTTSGYYYQRYFNEYNEDRIGARVTIGRKLDQYWSVLGTVRAEQVTVYNVPPFAPIDYQSVKGDNALFGFRAGVTRDSRDSFLRPTEGSLLDVSFEQVTGSQSYPLVNVDFSKYFTTYQRADGSGRHVLALHSQVGWAGNSTPVFERYFAGGFRSMRGFAFRGVGPDVNGFKVGGDFMVLNSAEYQIPVMANDKVYLVGFVDSGTVSPRLDDLQTYRVSAGFGVRFVVPMLGPVPIALDLGFPIVKANGDQQQVFNFWMGFTR
jgi:outer membrane protein assembly complex protein YaeT